MERKKEHWLMNAFDAARAHLATLPFAISGAGGHAATLRAACECVRFGLSDGDASALLREWNGTHCQPPWSEKELAHKLADARRKAGGQVRSFRQAPPAVRTVWKIQRKAAVEPSVQAPVQAPVQVLAEPLPLPTPQPSESLTGFWPVRPGAPIPAQFLDVLRTWPAFRQHPAWRNHPQLTNA